MKIAHNKSCYNRHRVASHRELKSRKLKKGTPLPKHTHIEQGEPIFITEPRYKSKGAAVAQSLGTWIWKPEGCQFKSNSVFSVDWQLERCQFTRALNAEVPLNQAPTPLQSAPLHGSTIVLPFLHIHNSVFQLYACENEFIKNTISPW